MIHTYDRIILVLLGLALVATVLFAIWFTNYTKPVAIPVSTTPVNIDQAVKSGGLVINEY